METSRHSSTSNVASRYANAEQEEEGTLANTRSYGDYTHLHDVLASTTVIPAN